MESSCLEEALALALELLRQERERVVGVPVG